MPCQEFAGTFPERCTYSITTPRKGIIYGTKVPMEYKITPIVKGIRIKWIKHAIREHVEICGWDVDILRGPRLDKWYTLCEDKIDNLDNALEADELDGSFTLKHDWPLPRSLHKLRPSYTDWYGLKFTHELRLVVGLLNADGHVSEVRALSEFFILLAWSSA
jgi:arrestin-related trafficking adapter 4/5/7